MGGAGAYNDAEPPGPPTLITKSEAENLVQQYGSPIYFYDTATVIDRFTRLKAQLVHTPSNVFYAMKANYNPYILSEVQKLGGGVESISAAEIHLALAVGFAKDKILFTTNTLQDEEMHEVHNLGVLLNIDSVSRLKKYGEAYPNSRVCVRFNPGILAGEFKQTQTAGEDSKFGIPLNRLDQVLSIIKQYNLNVVGIHQHPGSGIQHSEEFLNSANAVLNIIKKENFPNIEFIDLGGGLKVRYKPTDREPDFRGIFTILSGVLKEITNDYGRDIELRIEPGKFIVAECGHLLLKAIEIKERTEPGKINIGTDSSFSHLLRPVLYGAYHHLLNLSNPDGPPKVYQILGNICESGDVFADDREVPTIRENDVLCLLTAGAYGYSMGSLYNLRPLPTEIVRVDGKLVLARRKQKPVEMAESILRECQFPAKVAPSQ
eukprot:TRINITY_DN12792_c0_g1_i1.p1 TRINITY_DN12792_c0_g1~~TRINITY_DN12792_c0_g1_i1.p1  ORF type:complete len:461 (-),score=68.48 TRINITY_DN12792_c0_g1_i1:28-1326(-)